MRVISDIVPMHDWTVNINVLNVGLYICVCVFDVLCHVHDCTYSLLSLSVIHERLLPISLILHMRVPRQKLMYAHSDILEVSVKGKKVHGMNPSCLQ